jgi:SAM-dependent methyltransferase
MAEVVTEEAVRLAYLLFFGRPPENADVVRYALSYGTLDRVRDAFLNSQEFEFLLKRRPRLVRADAPPLDVAWQADDTAAQALLDRLRVAWAATPPGPPVDAGAEADATGAQQARDVIGCLRRVGVDPAALRRVFEFGCGSGRVARHLVRQFPEVAGCDPAPPRLAEAARAGLSDLAGIDDLRLGMHAPFDLWYSFRALQCFPPALIARVLQRALALLRPGGAAIFQVPTYGYGYRFSPGAEPVADPALDRHVLPQPIVFGIAERAGCAPLEVFEDLAVAPNLLWRSTVFVLHKPADG